MLKIFSIPQVQRADKYTIENEPIASIDLMERAASACVNWIVARNRLELQSYIVFCGPGNNGGDGLAIGRMLAAKGHEIMLVIPDIGTNLSSDFRTNNSRINEANIRIKHYSEITTEDFSSSAVVIDALFGSGLSKPVDGIFKDLITMINQSGCKVISIDIPSGLYADQPAAKSRETVIRASHTLSLQFPKLAFMMAENEDYFGSIHILPIGIHEDFIQSEPAEHLLTEATDIGQILKPRKIFAHKGNFGHALLIGGSKGKIGAAALMGKACLRAGAGLATLHVPACGSEAIHSSVHELMISADPDDSECSRLPQLMPYTAVSCGPGLGTGTKAASLLKLLIQECRVPLVLDADALNILSENKTWLGFLPRGIILTPHPGEFERLAGKSQDSFSRLELLKTFCLKYGVYVILKGARTVICSPSGNCYFNPTGNPGMATAGSGDVLTGVITGLLAQGYHPLEACLLAVWLHGKAGDLAAKRTGMEAMIATDIIGHLGKSFKKAWRKR